MSESIRDRDLEAKIVVLGAQGVGKTALLNRYIGSSFDPAQRPTIGANFLTKRILSTDTSPPIAIKLQIWDTAGQERFRSISKLYYRGANAAVLCYDITDDHSFEEMASWMEELRNNAGSDCLIHVVGTKTDVVAEHPSKRRVPFERCIQYISENHLQYKEVKSSRTIPDGASTVLPDAGTPTPGHRSRHSGFWDTDLGWDSCHEISAKDGDGVDEVFRVLIRKLIEQRRHQDRELDRQRAGSTSSVAGDAAAYFDKKATGRGSFRLGLGDKRRSWLVFSNTPGLETVSDGSSSSRGRCC